MYSEHNRTFSYAVLASIVLHGMLLFGVSQRERPRPVEPQVPPLLARLVEPPAPAPLAAPLPPQAEPVKPRPRPRPAAPRPVAKPAPTPQPEPLAEPAAEEPLVETVEPVAPAPAPVAPPVIARVDPVPQIEAPATLPPAALPPPATAKVIDPGLLAQYREQLIGAARKHKRYPRLAMENNWEGDVVVRMAFGGNGLLAGLSIQSSSGYAVLDQQALEMFKQAAKTIAVPPALRGKEFSFEVRAIYNLRDQDSG
jgi:protein TonB